MFGCCLYILVVACIRSNNDDGGGDVVIIRLDGIFLLSDRLSFAVLYSPPEYGRMYCC